MRAIGHSPAVITVYHYAKCSTCRKALKWLDARGIEYVEKPIKEQRPSERELREVLAACGGELRRLFNSSGMDYRAMGMKDQLPGMSEKDAIRLLRGNGMLVKRPLVVGEGVGLAGFREKEWEEALG